jgi:single-strand DNA-binding protein
VGFNDPFNKDKSNFIDCVSFGKTAETIGEYLKKGDPILMTGRLQQDRWTAKDGTNRSKVVLNCERFTFVPKSGGTDAKLKPNTDSSVDNQVIPF